MRCFHFCPLTCFQCRDVFCRKINMVIIIVAIAATNGVIIYTVCGRWLLRKTDQQVCCRAVSIEIVVANKRSKRTKSNISTHFIARCIEKALWLFKVEKTCCSRWSELACSCLNSSMACSSGCGVAQWMRNERRAAVGSCSHRFRPVSSCWSLRLTDSSALVYHTAAAAAVGGGSAELAEAHPARLPSSLKSSCL